MYIVDFVKRICRKGNIPVLIYLIINVFLIAIIAIDTFKTSWVQAFMLGMSVYGASLIIALSPIGEWILRLQTGCKTIKRKEFKDFIFPIFEEVYAIAKEKDSSISNRVRLFITNDEEPNAFATGRNTICITKGLLNASEDEIRAILGHEFGHLAHKDTDLILVVSVGNFIVTAIFIAFRLFARVIAFVFSICGLIGGEIIIHLGATISGVITDVLLVLLMRVWTKFGMLLVMKSSRSQEYEADKFSADLGFGSALCEFLDRFDGSGFQGLFASLMSTHPDEDSRIAALQEYGVDYSLSR